MGYILQILGVLLGIIGFFTHLGWLFMLGGFLCLFLDVMGFLSGRLNPLFPIFLYIGGWIIVGNWTGILWGSIIGNFIDTFLIILGGTGFAVFAGIKGLFRKEKTNNVEEEPQEKITKQE